MLRFSGSFLRHSYATLVWRVGAHVDWRDKEISTDIVFFFPYDSPVQWIGRVCLFPVLLCAELCAHLFISPTEREVRPSQPCDGKTRSTSDLSVWFVLPGNGLQNMRMQKKTDKKKKTLNVYSRPLRLGLDFTFLQPLRPCGEAKQKTWCIWGNVASTHVIEQECKQCSCCEKSDMMESS